MKKTIILFGTLFLFVLLTPCFAQYGDSNKGDNRIKSKKYNISTVITLKGKITNISLKQRKRFRRRHFNENDEFDKRRSNSGRKKGFYTITIVDDKQEMKVFLAPLRFIDMNDIILKKGDVVTVTGSVVNFKNNKKVLLASIFKNNDGSYKIRNANGRPLWRQRRRRYRDDD